MNIFLTGHNGFIGSYVREHLRQKGHNVITLNHNPRISKELLGSPLFQKNIEDVDIAVHLAANPNGNAGFDAYKENVEMTYCLSETLPHRIPIIFSSSITVYGDNTWAKEEDIDLLRPTTIYGLSKLACEDLLVMYARRLKRRTHILRLCATVGPNMSHGLLKDMIRKIEAPGNHMTLFGNRPGTCKQYMHVEGVADAIESCLYNNSIDIDIMNVTPSGHPLTVEEIANIAMEELGVGKEIVWDASKVWVGDNPVLAADNTKYVNRGLTTFTSKSSIRKTLRDYKMLSTR